MLASVLLVVATGCVSMSSKTQRLQLGMTKDQVVKLMGRKHSTVGARETTDARRMEVLRYEDGQAGELLLYFRDGRLVQWGDRRVLDNIPE
jgi:hypothetical protein